MKALSVAAALALSAFTLPAVASDLESGSAFSDMWGGSAGVTGNDSWTGTYIGLNVGYGMASSQERFTSTGVGVSFASPEYSDSQPNFGAYAGYNYQIDNFVIGAEAQVTYLDYTLGEFMPASASWQWSLGLRGGVLITDTSLLYLRAAWALTDVKYKELGFLDGPGYSVTDGFLSAFQLGGGVETKVADNWLLRVEANYTMEGGDASITDYFTESSVKLDPALLGVNLGLAYQF